MRTPEDNAIYEVLELPAIDRISFVRQGHKIQIGDFAWATPKHPKDKDGMVHLTGYDENFRNIWYAELKFSEVRFVGPKPENFHNGKNPFTIKPHAEV